MSIYRLNKALIFPPARYAEKDGLLAVGGDLNPERLLLAYRNGIFPWYNEGSPILWWSPDPRCVLYPEKLKVSKSMRQILKRNIFEITFNKDFEAVIRNCRKTVRTGQDGTWITRQMQLAYIDLYTQGHARSVEVWMDGKMVGGLYGIVIGKCFFGESMFSLVSNASKAGFITFANMLMDEGFQIIDCQVTTKHLLSLGGQEISRELFLKQLQRWV